ncbi:hypothetical protein V2J09_015355 [Rumex salicifolius]
MEEEYSGEHQRPSHHGNHQPSTTELMESAKMLASAAQSAAGGKTDSIDKARVASAAEDFLGAAQQYGKLDETSGIGKYVDKAEDYLHKYHSSDSQHAGGGREDEDNAPVSDHRRQEGEGYRSEEKDDRRQESREEEEGYRREEKEDRRHENRRHEDEEEETGSGGGSGVGEYINMAKGLITGSSTNKHCLQLPQNLEFNGLNINYYPNFYTLPS